MPASSCVCCEKWNGTDKTAFWALQNDVFRRAVCRNKMQASGFEMNVSAEFLATLATRRSLVCHSNPEEDTEKIQALVYSPSQDVTGKYVSARWREGLGRLSGILRLFD